MEDKEVVLRRARNAVIARDFNLAIRLYKSLLQEDVKNLEYLKALGDLYTKAGDDIKALSYYQQILTFYTNNFEAMNCCGGIYRRMGKYTESINILQKALETGLNPAQVNYNLGFTYKLMGDNQDAIECFENVIATNPTDVLAYNHLGSIYAGEKDHAKAVATYKRGLQVDPNHPILQFNMAKSLEAMHDDGAAIQAYEAALRAKPGWQDAIIAYSEMLLEHRKTKAAGELVQSGIGLHPQDAGLYVQMGRILMKQSDFEKAASSFEIANRLAAKDAKTLEHLAAAYEKQGRSSDAFTTIREARQIAPEDADIKKTAVGVMLSSNKLQEAANIIRELSTTNKTDCEVLDLAGQYSILAGKEDSAEKYSDRIKSLNPEYIAYLYSYASRYVQKGNYVAAKSKIKAFIDEKMKDVPAWILLGQIDEALGNPTDALDDYSTAIAFDPNNKMAENLAKKLGEKIDSESNSMEKQHAESNVTYGEEISLDEFGLTDEADESIVPDEEISEPVLTDGLTEENDVDVLGMEDVTSLFESGDDGLVLPENEDDDGIQADKDKVEEKMQEEESPVEEEALPEPFEDNSRESTINIDGNPDTSFAGWEDIDPSESHNEETLPDMDVPFSDPTTAGHEEEGLSLEEDPFAEIPQESFAPDAESVPNKETEKQQAEIQAVQNAAEEAKHAAEIAKNAMELARQAADSEEMKKIRETAEKAENSAREAMESAEKSWKAAQNAADMVQDAQQAQKIVEQKTEDALAEIQKAAEDAASAVTNAACDAENAVPVQSEKSKDDEEYENLVFQVSGMLPRLSRMLEKPEEISRFRKELELFKRLRDLGSALPFEQKEKFLSGRIRLLLDYIISRLSGKPGLLKVADDYRQRNNLPAEGDFLAEDISGSEGIEKVIRYMELLAGGLKDENLCKALVDSADEVLCRLSGKKERRNAD